MLLPVAVPRSSPACARRISHPSAFYPPPFGSAFYFNPKPGCFPPSRPSHANPLPQIALQPQGKSERATERTWATKRCSTSLPRDAGRTHVERALSPIGSHDRSEWRLLAATSTRTSAEVDQKRGRLKYAYEAEMLSSKALIRPRRSTNEITSSKFPRQSHNLIHNVADGGESTAM